MSYDFLFPASGSPSRSRRDKSQPPPLSQNSSMTEPPSDEQDNEPDCELMELEPARVTQ